MKIIDFPKRIEIELSNYCNSKCVYCPRNFGVGEQGFLPLNLYRKIIDEAREYPDVVLQLHRRGESLLHPDFIGILEYAKGKFKEIQLATNAILLDKKRSEAIKEAVDFISFSIDLPEFFVRRRGVDLYSEVEKNIIYFLKINAKTKTQVSMVQDDTIKKEDIAKFKELWMDKVDRVRIYERHSANGVYGALAEKRTKRLPCVKPFTDLVIYWNGKVVRCNHDWSENPLGDINEDTIAEIWLNAEFERIRKEQLSLQFSDDVCRKCDSWYPEEGRQQTGYIFSVKETDYAN